MNKYVFIIWNKALFCKEKIINDLESSFTVTNCFYIQWDKNKFKDCLKSLYGHKAVSLDEKIRNIGKGKFCVVVFEDSNSTEELTIVNDEEELINPNVLKKKKLYRKWTAESFRVHGSLNQKETSHDLTILLGPDYENELKAINNEETINKNPVGIDEFNNKETVVKVLDNIQDTHYSFSNSYLLIFTSFKEDVMRPLGLLTKNDRYSYSLKIKDEVYDVNLFGEKDGDLPEGFIKTISNRCINHFIDIKDEYISFLKNQISNNLIDEFLDKYGMKGNKFVVAVKKENRIPLTKKIKSDLRYILARIKYY